jgi:hypothetical protein
MTLAEALEQIQSLETCLTAIELLITEYEDMKAGRHPDIGQPPKGSLESLGESLDSLYDEAAASLSKLRTMHVRQAPTRSKKKAANDR